MEFAESGGVIDLEKEEEYAFLSQSIREACNSLISPRFTFSSSNGERNGSTESSAKSLRSNEMGVAILDVGVYDRMRCEGDPWRLECVGDGSMTESAFHCQSPSREHSRRVLTVVQWRNERENGEIHFDRQGRFQEEGRKFQRETSREESISTESRNVFPSSRSVEGRATSLGSSSKIVGAELKRIQGEMQRSLRRSGNGRNCS